MQSLKIKATWYIMWGPYVPLAQVKSAIYPFKLHKHIWFSQNIKLCLKSYGSVDKTTIILGGIQTLSKIIKLNKTKYTYIRWIALKQLQRTVKWVSKGAEM